MQKCGFGVSERKLQVIITVVVVIIIIISIAIVVVNNIMTNVNITLVIIINSRKCNIVMDCKLKEERTRGFRVSKPKLCGRLSVTMDRNLNLGSVRSIET